MEAMFYVSNKISQIPGVIDTFPHEDLATQGRWSTMTNTMHFKAVTAAPGHQPRKLDSSLLRTRKYHTRPSAPPPPPTPHPPTPILSIQNTTI